MGKTQHVVPHNGNWAVKGEHNVKVTKPFSRKSDATDFGRKIARNQESELVIRVCQVKCVSFFRYHKRRCVTSDCWL